VRRAVVILSRRSSESRSDGTAQELKIRGSGWNPFGVTRLRLELRILNYYIRKTSSGATILRSVSE
jgi:hypothetical protein